MEALGFLPLFGFIFVLYPAFVFLLAPFIIALTRKKYSRETLKKIAFIDAVCGFVVLSISFSLSVGTFTFIFLSMCLWSVIAYAFLKKSSCIESDCLEYDPNRIVECKSCGYRSKKFFNACPKCGNYTKRYVYLNEDTAEYNHCCGSCGEKCGFDDNFCSKCGAKIIQK